MTNQQVGADRATASGGMIALRLLVAVVSAIVSYFLVVFGGFMVMATDTCFGESTEFVCSEAGGNMLGLASLGGMILGVGSFLLAALCWVRSSAGWWGTLGALWAVAILGWTLSAAVAS